MALSHKNQASFKCYLNIHSIHKRAHQNKNLENCLDFGVQKQTIQCHQMNEERKNFNVANSQLISIEITDNKEAKKKTRLKRQITSNRTAKNPHFYFQFIFLSWNCPYDCYRLRFLLLHIFNGYDSYFAWLTKHFWLDINTFLVCFVVSTSIKWYHHPLNVILHQLLNKTNQTKTKYHFLRTKETYQMDSDIFVQWTWRFGLWQ